MSRVVEERERESFYAAAAFIATECDRNVRLTDEAMSSVNVGLQGNRRHFFN